MKSSDSGDLLLDDNESVIYEQLKKWRAQQAVQEHLLAEDIISAKVLMRIVKHRPDNLAALEKIEGMSSIHVHYYGRELIELLKRFQRKDAYL